MNKDKIPHNIYNRDSSEFNMFLYMKNLRSIIIFSSALAFLIILSVFMIDANQKFLILSSILLIVYFFIILCAVIFKKKNSFKLYYVIVLNFAFFISTMLWAFYNANYILVSVHDFYFFLLVIIFISTILTCLPLINFIVILLMDFLGATFISSLDNNYLLLVLISVSFISFIVNLIRYGNLYTIFIQDKNITEKNYILKEMTYKDLLTNLYNNRFVFEKLEDEIERAIRYDTPLCLILLDIDNFDQINDKYGQLVGDETLSSIGDILLELCRTTDVIGRYSGEEFIIVLPNTNLEDSITLAERLRITIKNRKINNIDQVTVSIGVKAFDESLDLSTLIDLTDDLLYHSKQSGKDSINY